MNSFFGRWTYSKLSATQNLCSAGRTRPQVDKIELWLAQIRSIRVHDSDCVSFRNLLTLKDRRALCRYVLLKQNGSIIPKNFLETREAWKGPSIHRCVLTLIYRTVSQFGEFERINSNQAGFIPTSTCCGEYSDGSEMDRTHGASQASRRSQHMMNRILSRRISSLVHYIIEFVVSPDSYHWI